MREKFSAEWGETLVEHFVLELDPEEERLNINLKVPLLIRERQEKRVLGTGTYSFAEYSEYGIDSTQAVTRVMSLCPSYGR